MAALIDKSVPEALTSDQGDLKRRLIDHMDMVKRPNDLVRITQVSKHHFRVNTLSPRTADDAVMQTYSITRSQFVHVEDRRGELVITDQTRS